MRHDLKECGKRIQHFRKERGLTQEQLAEKLYVSQNTIVKIELDCVDHQLIFCLNFQNFSEYLPIILF